MALVGASHARDPGCAVKGDRELFLSAPNTLHLNGRPRTTARSFPFPSAPDRMIPETAYYTIRTPIIFDFNGRVIIPRSVWRISALGHNTVELLSDVPDPLLNIAENETTKSVPLRRVHPFFANG